MGPNPASSAQRTRPLVVLSANSAWNILNFRRPLLEALQSADYRIIAIVPDGEGIPALEGLGVGVVVVSMSPRGMSPASDTLLFLRYLRLLNRLRPAAFLGFTAKPNIYGGIAARALGIPTINNITGLGTSFLSGRFLERFVSGLYRLALSNSAMVLFHNEDDLELFVARGLVARHKARVIPGSGIDLKHFAPSVRSTETALRFLFVGRLLTDKGIVEFGEAAVMLQGSLPDARFIVIGEWSPHPRAAPRDQLNTWADDGLLEFVGAVKDVRPFLESADCVVLPSYREGLPRVLLEASAMARPSIAADVPGCRQVIEDGVTGYLCEVRSAPALAQAILTFASLTADERSAMGQGARERAEERFGAERVSNAYISVLAELPAKISN